MTWLIHIPVDAKAFSIWSSNRDMKVKGVFDADHAAHVLLSALFGKAAFQPFRLHTPEKGDWAFFGHSNTSAEDLRKMAKMVGGPEMLKVLKLDQMVGRELPEDLSGLKRIGYEIRICPTRRRSGDKNREVDAWISEGEYRFPGQKSALKDAGITRETVYRKWFAERLAGVAELQSFQMTRYQTRKMVRSGHVMEAPDVVAQGTLFIDDAEKFAKILHEGLGRGKAYGFGLLMLRPAERERDF